MSDTYWIFFKEGEFKFKWLFKKGYTHIYIVTKDEYNWLLLDPAKEKFNWKILPIEPNDESKMIEQFVNDAENILKVELLPPEERLNYVRPLGPHTCLAVAKYIMGLKNWCLTPWQLYKNLINKKNKRVKSYHVYKISR